MKHIVDNMGLNEVFLNSGRASNRRFDLRLFGAGCGAHPHLDAWPDHVAAHCGGAVGGAGSCSQSVMPSIVVHSTGIGSCGGGGFGEHKLGAEYRLGSGSVALAQGFALGRGSPDGRGGEDIEFRAQPLRT